MFLVFTIQRCHSTSPASGDTRGTSQTELFLNKEKPLQKMPPLAHTLPSVQLHTPKEHCTLKVKTGQKSRCLLLLGDTEATESVLDEVCLANMPLACCFRSKWVKSSSSRFPTAVSIRSNAEVLRCTLSIPRTFLKNEIPAVGTV